MKTPTELPVLKKYDLSAPVANDVYAAVASLDYRHFTRNWRKICKAAGVSPQQNVLSIEELYSLGTALTNFGGAYSLLGRALDIRTKTYEDFSRELANDDDFEPVDPGRRALDTFERTRYVKPEQLRAVSTIDLFSESNTQRLDEVAAQAADALGADLAAANVLLGCSVATPGFYGPMENSGGAPVEWTFCATTFKREDTYAVPDLARNIIQKDSPYVKHFGLAAYAGVPMRTSDGTMVATLCVFYNEPRSFDNEDIRMLNKLGSQAMAEIEG